MKRLLSITGIALLVLLAGGSAFAQTTSTINGTVTTDGAALPGVTVTLSSPQMQGTRTAVTGEAGGYSFAGIPPGTYTITFELAGMQTVSRSVKVGVGQSGKADATMRVSAVAEAITVTAGAPSVLETPTLSQSISYKTVDELPINRTPLAAALLAPGVSDNTPSGGQLSISGSPGYDNLVLVNGVSITENVRHQELGLYIEDAIQETTVMTGAIPAEYGGFTGGVVNSITKAGGNEFSGSFRDSLTNPSWQEKTPLQKTNNTKLLDKTNSVYEATLGGFILRDRLWFFGAGRKTNTSAQNFLRVVPGDPTKFSQDYTTSTDEKRWEGKLTGQITDKHSVIASYLDYSRDIQNSVFTSTSYDLAQLSNRSDPRTLESYHYNGILTRNWLVEAQYSAMDWGVAWGNGSQFTDVIRGTIVRNRSDSNARFNSPTFCGVCDKETRSNDGWNIKSHYFYSNNTFGNHDIVGGIERFAEHRHSNNYQSGSNFRVFVNSVQRLNGTLYPTVTPGRQSSATFIFWTPILSQQQGESDLASDALFLNDRWELNSHWSFNVGVRYDKNDAVDGTGNKISDDSKITPRLSATYDVAGNGRHRVTGSFAQYASRIVDGPATAASSAGSPASVYFSYLGPAINPAGTPVDQLLDTHQALQIIFDWFNNACNAQGKCGTSNLELLRPNTSNFVPGYDTLISNSLSSPYVEEWALGYATQWKRNIVTRVDFVARDWNDFYAYQLDQNTVFSQIDPLGISHDVATVVNTNDVSRKYRGIQFQGAWAPNRFNVGVNYTYSKLRGNDEQESPTSGTVGNSPGTIYYPEVSNFSQRLPVGYLSQDQRHRLRAWVGYDVPMPRYLGQVNISAVERLDSGLPYSAVQNIDLTPYLNSLLPANSKYDLNSVPANRQYYFGGRGAFRYDDVTATDVALNYNYPIGKVQIFATGEVINVFNADTVILVNQSVSTAATSGNFLPFNPYTDTPKECPQGTPGATCKAMGANWQKGSNFGQPTSSTLGFQTPRTWRFQFGVRF